eukprot:3257351-Rhodomonas_salina.1
MWETFKPRVMGAHPQTSRQGHHGVHRWGCFVVVEGQWAGEGVWGRGHCAPPPTLRERRIWAGPGYEPGLADDSAGEHPREKGHKYSNREVD